MQGSLQYSIYKGTGGNHGALQLNFQKPHFYNQKQKDFTGDIALEIKRNFTMPFKALIVIMECA